MMTHIILGRDEDLLNWAIGQMPELSNLALPAVCIGFASQDMSKLYAVAIYNNFRHYDIEISFVATTPRWATPSNIRVVMDYPFNQLGVKRMSAFTAKSNKRARKLNEGVGFKLEGVHPFGWFGSEDACSYGITEKTVREKWLKNG